MAIVFYGVMLVLMLVIVACLVQIGIMNFPWGTNALKDATTGPLPLYNAQETGIRRLAKLGFQQLGVLEVRLFWRRNLFSEIWYYIDPTATTWAAVSSYRSKYSAIMIVFGSWFPDHALIETYYPIGENFDEPAHSAHFVKENIELGYAHHQEVIQQWRGIHGEPLVIHDVKQLIPFDAVDMKLHRRRRYRRFTNTLGLLILVCLIGIVILVYSAGIDLTGADLAQIVQRLMVPALMLSFCLAAIVLLIYPIVNPPGALDA